jgi:hypothetical protein
MVIKKRFIVGTGAQTYTSPANVRSTVHACSACNVTAGAVACSITFAGGVIETKTLDPGESWIFTKAINQTLEPAEAIVSAGTGVDFLASGVTDTVKP